MDFYKFNQAIMTKLNNRDNFEVFFGEKVTAFEKQGNNITHVITDNQKIKCDAVVMSTGATTANIMWDTLKHSCPVIGVKGYSLDLVSDCLTLTNKCLYIGSGDKFLCIVPVEQGRWRITTYGDIAGNSNCIDPKRIKQIETSIQKTIIDHFDMEKKTTFEI